MRYLLNLSLWISQDTGKISGSYSIDLFKCINVFYFRTLLGFNFDRSKTKWEDLNFRSFKKVSYRLKECFISKCIPKISIIENSWSRIIKEISKKSKADSTRIQTLALQAASPFDPQNHTWFQGPHHHKDWSLSIEPKLNLEHCQVWPRSKKKNW